MTRIPEAGRVKTRLVPVLGPDGAAALHTALLVKTLQIADSHGRQSNVGIEIRFTGGTLESVDALRTERLAIWREQQGMELGERIHIAIETALHDGAHAVIVIGTDCPDLTADVLRDAWRLLDHRDVVLGPADDGGYYLIGIKQANAGLFAGIDWGTEHVLRQTKQRCRELGKSFALLPLLSDVDEAENLVVCRRIVNGFEDCLPQPSPGLLSVVIPTLNDVGQFEDTVKPILQQPHCEIIVADGGSTDGIVDLAKQLGCRLVISNRGRGRQMNAGAAMARGEYFLFLHADTRLPTNFREEIHATLEAGAIAGAFRFQIDQPGWGLRCIEWSTHLRATILQLPYGDQGLFLRSQDFFRVGGFKNWPIMEDFDLCRRLKNEGRIRLAPSPAPTSGRRWKRLGALRNTLVNQVCIAMYFAGASPQRIADFYAGAPSLECKTTPGGVKNP